MRRSLIAAATTAGLVLAPGVSASAAAGNGPRTRSFSTIAVGAMISTSGDRFEKVFRIKRSPDGGGGAIQDGVLDGATFPVGGHDTMDLFFRDGLQTATDAFRFGVPGVDGIGAVTGTGRCTGGTGAHKGERCSYKITGTYDIQTTVTKLRLAGTFTR
jgi:hypothetical protein